MPAAVSHTDINIETNCAKRIELDVFNILRYCKMSGTVIKRRALRNLSPATDKGTLENREKRDEITTVIEHWFITTDQDNESATTNIETTIIMHADFEHNYAVDKSKVY